MNMNIHMNIYVNDWLNEWMYINACRISIWVERKHFAMRTATATNDKNGAKHSTKTLAKKTTALNMFWIQQRAHKHGVREKEREREPVA